MVKNSNVSLKKIWIECIIHVSIGVAKGVGEAVFWVRARVRGSFKVGFWARVSVRDRQP